MGVWIETYILIMILNLPSVTPFVGVWIETKASCLFFASTWSHPSWVCGLKRNGIRLKLEQFNVTPFVGVWIETTEANFGAVILSVTPFVGVWIETITFNVVVSGQESHPSWVCGLKLCPLSPFVARFRHTLRGCVD